MKTCRYLQSWKMPVGVLAVAILFATSGAAKEITNYVRGGGHALEALQQDDKRKDWLDFSFGGWAAETKAGLVGKWQVYLHNVDADLDKSKFHGTDVTALNFFDGNNASCHSAMNVTINGTFNGEDGYSIIFRAGDNGSPNVEDTVRVTIYDGENGGGSVVYDSHAAGEFTDESNCVGTARTGLDTGNITIAFE